MKQFDKALQYYHTVNTILINKNHNNDYNNERSKGVINLKDVESVLTDTSGLLSHISIYNYISF